MAVIGNYTVADEGGEAPVSSINKFTNSINFSGINQGFPVNSKSNYLVVLQHYALNSGNGLTPYVKIGGITGQGNYTLEAITNVTSKTAATKLVGGQLKFTNVNVGNAVKTTLTRNAESYRELMLVKISANSAENIGINRIKVSLVYTNGSGNSDFTNLRILIDNNNSGTYDGSDIQIGQAVNNPVSGLVNFSNITGLTIKAGYHTNVLLTTGHKILTGGKGVTALINNGNIIGVGVSSGQTNNATGTALGIKKEVPANLYVANVSNGNVLKKYLFKTAEVNREIIGIKLSTGAGENITLSKVAISLNYANGMNDSSLTNYRLFIDNNILGTYETGIDTLLGIINKPSSGKLTFSGIHGLTIPANSHKNILLIANHGASNSQARY